MTVIEVSEKYHIPTEILEEYRSWGLCGAVKTMMEDWKYTDEDLERLSLIMTLHDIGFTTDEVERYVKLLLLGDSTENARLTMLNQKRSSALDEIHFKEKQVERLDYIRYKMNAFQKGK